MRDFIKGLVKRVIDEHSIEIEVTQNGRNNNRDYHGSEEIRVSEIKPFLFSRKSGFCSKTLFEMILLGKEVTCLVYGRNSHGQIEGDVFLL
jgi:type VI protein secretion system component Hcp